MGSAEVRYRKAATTRSVILAPAWIVARNRGGYVDETCVCLSLRRLDSQAAALQPAARDNRRAFSSVLSCSLFFRRLTFFFYIPPHLFVMILQGWRPVTATRVIKTKSNNTNERHHESDDSCVESPELLCGSPLNTTDGWDQDSRVGRVRFVSGHYQQSILAICH